MMRDLLWVMLLAAGGCVSFEGGLLDQIAYDEIESLPEKAHITYDLNFLSKDTDTAKAIESFRVTAAKVFIRSECFSTYVEDSDRGGYHLSLTLEYETSSYVSVYLSVFTLLIIPGHAEETFILNAAVSGDHRVLKQYRYKDTMDTWIQLLLIFPMPFTSPDAVRKGIVENMLLHFLRDLSRDGFLLGPAS